MRKAHFEKFKKVINKAVKDHLAKGGKLCGGTFTRDDGAMCPLTCVMGEEPASSGWSPAYWELIGKVAGVPFTIHDMERFYCGFDNSSGSASVKRTKLYQLGKQLRAKYLSKSKYLPKEST
jgi:hypothetical protein